MHIQYKDNHFEDYRSLHLVMVFKYFAFSKLLLLIIVTLFFIIFYRIYLYLKRNREIMIKIVKKIIKSFDLFSSTILLRYQEETQHKTTTGGLFSIAIIIVIFLTFTNMVVQTLSLNNFTIKTNIQKNQIPVQTDVPLNPSISNFMFGLQILPLNLSDPQRYFDISLTHQVLKYGNLTQNQQIPLQPCTKLHWRNYPILIQSFDYLKVGKWLCPSMNLTMDLQGKYSSNRFSQYQLKVSSCKNTTNQIRKCHSKQNITKFFKQNKDILYFTVYFINTIINPSQKQYKKYYLEDQNYAIFGPNIGTQNYLLLTDYTITTDQSVWPYTSMVQDTGVIVQNSAQKYSFQHTANNEKYISFYLAKATNSLKIERSVQKMTQLFGFIQGTVVAFITLLFLVKLYADFSFEISLAYNIFQRQKNLKSQDNDNPKTQQQTQNQSPNEQIQQISITKYFSYAFYKICNLFGKKIKWKQMIYLQECQEQIGKQLDIINIINRIAFLEYCIQNVLQDGQLEGLQLKRPRTAKQMKQIRQKFTFFIQKSQRSKEISSLQIQKNMIKYQKFPQNVKNIKIQQDNLTTNGLIQNKKSLQFYENICNIQLKTKQRPKYQLLKSRTPSNLHEPPNHNHKTNNINLNDNRIQKKIQYNKLYQNNLEVNFKEQIYVKKKSKRQQIKL